MSKAFGRALLASAAGLTLAATANVARAEPQPTPPTPAFGTQGQLVLDRLLGLSLTSVGMTSRSGLLFVPTGWLNGWHAKSKESEGGAEFTMESTTFSFAPSIDYFVTDRVSVGGSVVGAWSHRVINAAPDVGYDDDAKDRYLSFTPRVGFTWPLSEDITFWPRVGAGVTRGYSSYIDHEETSWEWSADAEALFAVRASKSLFFSLGPALTVQKFRVNDDTSGDTVRDVSLLGGFVKGTVGLVL